MRSLERNRDGLPVDWLTEEIEINVSAHKRVLSLRILLLFLCLYFDVNFEIVYISQNIND